MYIGRKSPRRIFYEDKYNEMYNEIDLRSCPVNKYQINRDMYCYVYYIGI